MRKSQCNVEQAAKTRLLGLGFAELRHVSCHFDKNESVLTLRGRVPSFYLKQRAQEAVRTLEAVTRIDNLLDVDDIRPRR